MPWSRRHNPAKHHADAVVMPHRHRENTAINCAKYLLSICFQSVFYLRFICFRSAIGLRCVCKWFAKLFAHMLYFLALVDFLRAARFRVGVRLAFGPVLSLRND